MKNLVSEGVVVTLVNGSTAISSGELVIRDNLLGVAVAGAAANEAFALRTSGIVDLPIRTSSTDWPAADRFSMSVGSIAYAWGGEVAEANGLAVGRVVEAPSSGASTVPVLLDSSLRSLDVVRVQTSTAIAASEIGSVFASGQLVGIVLGAAIAGGLVPIATSGPWDLLIASGVTATDLDVGDIVYVTSGQKRITETSTSNSRAGKVLKDASSGDTRVRVGLGL